jgi:hypothetical protein
VLDRLRRRARERSPALAEVSVRTRASFVYVDATTTDGETLRLCRLRYAHSATWWGFAIYLASKERYEDSLLPSGSPLGMPEEALECTCGLHLNDPTAWWP